MIYTADGSFICPVCDASFDGHAPENLPNNLYIESLLDVMASSTRRQARRPKSTVSFAPLPPRIRDAESSPTLKCRECSELCEKRCKHCKRVSIKLSLRKFLSIFGIVVEVAINSKYQQLILDAKLIAINTLKTVTITGVRHSLRLISLNYMWSVINRIEEDIIRSI